MNPAKSQQQSYWAGYWSSRMNGGHRSQQEDSLAKEAAEKYFHLGPAKSLLDFGCGSADLLVFYAGYYDKVAGADFSESMLKVARAKIEKANIKNASLLLADDRTLFQLWKEPVDLITATQVVQYMTPEAIDAFVSSAAELIPVTGKIALFDIIDPQAYKYWTLEGYNGNVSAAGIVYNWLKRQAKLFVNKFLNHIPGGDSIGFAHPPSLCISIAEGHGLKVEFARSMYYEYRYHAIFSKQSENR